MSLPRYPEYQESGVEWLGKIPGHWKLTRLKHVLSEIGSGGTPDTSNSEFWIDAGGTPWVAIADMSSVDRVKVTAKELSEQGVESKRLTIWPAGTLIFSMYASLGHVAELSVPAAINQALLALVPREPSCQRFLRYWLVGIRPQLRAEASSNTQDNLNAEKVANLVCLVPSAQEQADIANFLDRETAKIDALIAEQEKLLALLAEKRQATISHAVTRGLDPNVPMKNSGIAWLGDVPAHWDVMALGRMTISKCDGPFGSGLKSDHYVDAGARVIRLQNIRGGWFDDRDAAFIDLGYFESEMARHAVNQGDLLIAGLGDDNNVVGRACVAPADIHPALVKADCFRFRLNVERAVPEFAAWALTVGATYDAGILSSGSTRSRIPLTVMAARKIPLPPVREQVEISRHVEIVQSEFDQLISTAEEAIELLLERRSALIAAAVSGQIDVRGAVEPQAA